MLLPSAVCARVLTACAPSSTSSSIPVFLFWLKYLSFIKYGFAAMMQIQFDDRFVSNCTSTAGDGVCFGDGQGSFLACCLPTVAPSAP